MLQVGKTYTLTEKVTPENVAAAMASGTLPVYATPAMILLIERTCMELAQPHLDAGCSTVGTKLNIEHLSATPISMTVRAECTLREIDRRRLVFSCEVYDDAGLIGKGTHERFIVANEKFLSKTAEKLS